MSTATPTVIVVEDEAKIRRFIKLALEAEQLAVFETDSVARGLIEDHPIRLPGADLDQATGH